MSFYGGPVRIEGGGLTGAPVPPWLCSEGAIEDDSVLITVTAWDRIFSGPKGQGMKPIGWKEAQHRIKIRKGLAEEVRSIFE